MSCSQSSPRSWIAAVGYRLAGAEQLWIPRLVSSALWVVGGVFLYLIARRLTSRDGALVALVAYLFWTYSVWLSRLYMPDATMVALLLAAGAVARSPPWSSPASRSCSAVLAGLAVGYVAFALTVPGFTSTHAYYALPLVPLFALAVGSFAGWASARARAAGRVPFAACIALAALALGVGVYKGHAVLSGDSPSPAIADYRRIGALTGHTAHAIVVDERLRSPISYWGWMVARYWYPPTPAEDLPASGNPFPPWLDPADEEYLVVVAVGELETEPRLRSLVRKLPVVAQTPRFAVFDLRGATTLDIAEK